MTAGHFAYLRATGNRDAAVDYRTTTIDRRADLAHDPHTPTRLQAGEGFRRT